MLAAGPDSFERLIGPFPDGTEVWFVVAAATFDEGPVVSNETVFVVGKVVRGGASNLTIGSVVRSPVDPVSFDTVAVTATVTSTVNVSGVSLSVFSIGRSTNVASSEFMLNVGGSGYIDTIPPPSGSGPEIVVMYRVSAVDATGNTAVSRAYSYRVPLPIEVP